jgi:nicotinamide-nucleotide amidase
MAREAARCVDQQLVKLAQSVVDELRKAELTVITAESCTGGLIAAILSHAQHASDCLHGGFVVYTKANKTAALGVDPVMLDVEGSVNENVARQMVIGALERSPANLGISATGVLGPDPDEDGNPPGLVYLAIGKTGELPRVLEQTYAGSDPDSVRRDVIVKALEMLREAASA